MNIRSALLVRYVMHRRVRPRVHKFRYRAFWFLVDLDELAEISKRLRLFSHNRSNLFTASGTPTTATAPRRRSVRRWNAS